MMPAVQSATVTPTASPFVVRPLEHNGIAAVELRDTRSGAHAVFACRGATLLEWRVMDRGTGLALTDGYRSAAELATQDGVRNGVLAPFPNRIADGRYRFDGEEHDLLPGVADGARVIYHGFLRELDLALVAVEAGAHGARASFAGRIGAGDFPGYPFALALNVHVHFHPNGIGLSVAATNICTRPAPYAAGWHPYFRLGDAPLDQLLLSVPASHGVLTDHALLPLPGAAAFGAPGAGAVPDFRRPRALGDAVLDLCYAGAVADADDLIRSRLRDPASGRTLTVWQRGGFTHVFTGDTLARDPRRAIAIEPVEAMTDAFNRAECAPAIRLEPGATRSFRCGAVFSADAGAASAGPLNPTTA